MSRAVTARDLALRAAFSLLLAALAAPSLEAEEAPVERLVGALLGPTPLVDDLRELTDTIGGRPTGSEANRRSIEWAMKRFEEAGVTARKESFEMPALWLGGEARATIRGEGVELSPATVAMPFSPSTGPLVAPLLDAGRGTEQDFERLGESIAGAVLLVETTELEDIPGLFAEYVAGALIEGRALAADAAAVVYQGSRPGNQLYRHIASRGFENTLPLAVVERDGGARALRLLRHGHALEIELDLAVEDGPAFRADNVIGEIRGTQSPEEIVVIGAHIDSWGLGDGALDNGCNVALVVDIARQMTRLGLEPRRTIRFALWNGEEQILRGAWAYTRDHADELDRHVMASAFDIGSGRLLGFFTGGRPEILPVLEAALEPVAGLGPFQNLDVPVVGTDNYDFMMQGVANLVGNQASANYGPHYHARSDTFDKVDLDQVRLNAAIAAAVTWHFANADIPWGRQSRAEIQAIVDSTDLGDQMRTFGVLEAWNEGRRGRALE